MIVKKGPVIGISVGDVNGIGIELIIKTFSDSRITELCTPVIFASNKVINFYRKLMPEVNINYNNIKEVSKANPKQLNILSVWEEDVEITPGQATAVGGKYGVLSLQAAVSALKAKEIDADAQALATALDAARGAKDFVTSLMEEGKKAIPPNIPA